MNELVTVTELQTEQEQFINSIVESKGANLPDTIDGVLNVFEFTDWKAKAWKTLSDKLVRLDDQQEAYHSALRSGQQWGIAALYAQKRMGEITREMPKTRETDDGTVVGRNVAPKANVPYHSWNDAERIAAHPDVVDRVIETSQQRGEIPTKTAVLNTIRTESAKERAEKKEARQADKVENHRPRAVAEYYESIKEFRDAIKLAKQAAERGKFSPEGINLLQKKHDELRSMMNELEGMVQ